IAPAMQLPAAPPEPMKAMSSAPLPSGSVFTSAPQPTDKPINETPDSLKPIERIPAPQQPQQPQSEYDRAMAVADMLRSVIREAEQDVEAEEQQAKMLAEEERKSGVSIVGKDVETGQLVSMSQIRRRQGLYIIGVNGTGKSTLISNLIVQDIEQGLGVCLLDPHGDLTTQ